MYKHGILAVIGLCLVFSSQVGAVEVGSIADSRFEGSGGWTLDGANMTDTRSKLLNPDNFGPAGTYPEAVNVTDVADPITYTVLSTFDIFLVGYLADSDEDFITEDEGQAMFDWVSQGGTMVISCDDASHDAICIAFGLDISADSASPPANPTGLGETRPMFDGPFGTSEALTMAGTIRYFEETAGFSVLAEDQSGNPVILEALIGDGRVVALSDIDMISNHGLSNGDGIDSDNDRFLANLIAYLADEAVETFVINPGLNGNWWNGPARAGEGMQLELVIPGGVLTVVATFYSYDNAGKQIFLIAVGPVNIGAGNTTDVDVFITEGPVWGAGFDPGDVNEEQWGTGEISSSSCNLMHILLNPNPTYAGQGYSALEYDVIRLNPPAAPCPVPIPSILVR
ncbi:DUF4350 domain-containing protein [Elongatibacter sediminis]|uniref:DUF4350 domain-containing protein n=1 Tax=Elongatibacter sediminis TaxID=3119006 RepID=A0AAW9RAM7_9GAMM